MESDCSYVEAAIEKGLRGLDSEVSQSVCACQLLQQVLNTFLLHQRTIV